MKILAKKWWKVALSVVGIVVAGYFMWPEEKRVWVAVAAAHYFPEHHRIDEFYIDRRFYGHSGFDGGAGMGVCCVWLPSRWRPGMEVDVRWGVTDWTASPIDSDANSGTGKVKVVGIYRAKAQVEQYDEADDVFVHFFEGGKVRVAPGVRDFRKDEEGRASIERAASRAVLGEKVNEFFTAGERAEMLRETEKSHKQRGSWR